QLILAACCLLFVTAAHGQVTTATLYGIVRDQSGSILPGASVTAIHEGTATTRTTVTNDAGEFALAALPSGPYTIKIELQGFNTHMSRGIQLGSGQVARETFDLELGTIAETVTVAGIAPLIKTASSEQMETLITQQVRELPLSRRNITGLLRLAPGVD